MNSAARWALYPLSFLYGLGVTVRNWCYDVELCKTASVSVPVISVGNLTAGGTGKTPMIEYLVRYLCSREKKVAVISRGYRRSTTGTVIVSDHIRTERSFEAVGDEPFQMARKFPQTVVIVDEDRFRAATLAVSKYNAEVILLDDGFQHRRLRRNLDIVLVDGSQDLSRVPLLPAGLKREPLQSLKRANVIVSMVSGSQDQNLSLKEIAAIHVSAQRRPLVLCSLNGQGQKSLKELSGKQCIAFCGIGNPKNFRNTLQEIGLDVREMVVFPDHYRFQKNDIDRLTGIADTMKADIVVTTEKDSVRLQSVVDVTDSRFASWYYLEIETAITEGAEQFHHALDKTYWEYRP